jgi:hypothetical protein
MTHILGVINQEIAVFWHSTPPHANKKTEGVSTPQEALENAFIKNLRNIETA